MDTFFSAVDTLSAIVGAIFGIFIIVVLIIALVRHIKTKREQTEELKELVHNAVLQEFDVMEIKRNFIKLEKQLGIFEVVIQCSKDISIEEKEKLLNLLTTLKPYEDEILDSIKRYESLLIKKNF